jgi:hypothetical protein
MIPQAIAFQTNKDSFTGVSPLPVFMDRSPGLHFAGEISSIVIAGAFMVLVMEFHRFLRQWLAGGGLCGLP